jgi:hypothetical protein
VNDEEEKSSEERIRVTKMTNLKLTQIRVGKNGEKTMFVYMLGK